jgi:hypothetical protein
MANITKPKGDPSYCDSNGEERGRDRPTQALRPVEKLLPGRDIPTDLKMHGEGANEDPDSHWHTTSDEEGAGEGAGKTGVHIVRRDFVVALLRLCAEGYYKAKLRMLEDEDGTAKDHTYCHEHRSDDQTVTQVVPSCLFSW